MKRFETFTDEKRRNVVPKNTQKAEQAAERLFTEFLKEQSIRDMNKLSENMNSTYSSLNFGFPFGLKRVIIIAFRH